ncbi:hypothetical protein [Aliarcobacter butzleri]|uniref:hypothetical protein n=1 Tax=Aliarcobacter butzleri TaxID=28197 RepID=UPI001EDB47C1|nr:hypothetical protein [Aliarcobacter butzleri]MCG3685627.1 hypothetical protein [Aliarcobacter butzleri]MCG3711686.1 hypothetical protein [Aliarcobacter butzleri]MCG3714070.1 hypothetical protein [Aliarcobacter butzleri]MCT7562647.1 hypothetical protein [Aliarcobacter butzleri]MCT7637599.1 hypothetical protein [Aliarcobacter butzleri]
MKIVFKNFIFLDDSEAKEILELRNQSYIKENMINSENISLENHINFINSLKTLENRKYFAILEDNKIIGSLNYINNEDLSWGLYFKEDTNPIIKSCATYLFLDYVFGKFDEDLNSYVKKSNSIALAFNKNFGFKNFKDDEEFIYLKLSKSDWENQKNSKLLKPIKRYLDKIKFEFKEQE